MRGSDARSHTVPNSSAEHLHREPEDRHQPDVHDVVGAEEPERRTRRTAEEERGGDRRHRDDVHELGEEEDREPDAGVLGVEPADELLLGLDEVEGRVVRLGGRRDEEDHERHERAQPVPVDARSSRACSHACCAAIVCVESVCAWISTPRIASPNAASYDSSCAVDADRPEQRVLRTRRPPGEHHAVHAETRHREDEQHPDGQLGDLQVGRVAEDRDGAADRDHAEHQERRHDRQVGREPEHASGRPTTGSTAP